jgi:hypothetical protein
MELSFLQSNHAELFYEASIVDRMHVSYISEFWLLHLVPLSALLMLEGCQQK